MEDRGYHGSTQLHQKIQQCIQESKDTEFTRVLNQLGTALWNGWMNDAQVEKELAKNLEIYHRRMQDMPPVQTTVQTVQSVQAIQAIQPAPPKKKSMEFAIGAGVLGVLGALFLLTAFVIFAMNFMPGLVRGLCLYAISLTVIFVAEFWVRKKQEKFALGMLGAGFAGLFLTTIINYAVFSVFHDMVAIILSVLIVACAFFVSWKKNSGILRVIALLGSMVCLFPLLTMKDSWKFLVLGALVVLIQAGGALIPKVKGQNWVLPVQMVIAGISTVVFILRAGSLAIDERWLYSFLMLMLVVLNLLFIKAEVHAGSAAVFCLTYFFILLLLGPCRLQGREMYFYILMPLTMITIIFTFIGKHKIARWIPYWFFHFALLLCMTKMGSRDNLILLILVFVTAKLLFRVKELRVSDSLITGYSLLYMMGLNSAHKWEIIIFTAAFLLSVLCLKYFQTFHRLAITLAAVVGAWKLCPSDFRLPIVTGIFVLGIFSFQLMKKWKQAGTRTYNIVCLSMMAVCYLWLAFTDNLIVYLIMLCFGVTVFVICFDEKYELTSKNKYLWLGIFLAYMFVILRAEHGIVKSILLAGNAIFCVGTGFVFRQKAARLYGLVLAIAAALKVALLDCTGLETIQRILAFLIVGILILAISYLYFFLEKQIQTGEQIDERGGDR